MKEVVSLENMKKSDEYTCNNLIPSRELMYRAALGIYKNVSWHGKIAIVCGSGNNAADGYALASILNKNGYDVSIILLFDKLSNDGKYYFDICKEQGVSYLSYREGALNNYDIIVDCIFGIGFKGQIDGIAKACIEEINSTRAYIVCADINSGLLANSGICDLCVISDLTVSIGSYKSGHILGMAKDKIKSLVNCDIGIKLLDKPFMLIEQSDVKEALPKREHFSHKGTYGYVTLIGGSYEYSGALKLANLSASAVRSGAGVVRLATPKSIGYAVMPYILESTLYPLSEADGAIKFDENEIQGAINSTKSVGIGMGMGQRGDNEEVITYLLKNYSGTLVIDADGLNTLSKMELSLLNDAKCKVVLTPHLKEFERLSGIPVDEILHDPIYYAKDFAKKYGVILLLKGTSTIITDGEDVRITNTGCQGMASGGSGDVLLGIISALCAQMQGRELEAVWASAYINGRAGEIASRQLCDISMSAGDTAMCVALSIKEIVES